MKDTRRSGPVEHMTYVPKSWGSEIWVINNESYCGKVLRVSASKYCSFHYHKLKEETLTVVSGQVLMLYADQSEATTLATNDVPAEVPVLSRVLHPGQAWHILPGYAHQFFALEDSVIFETSTHHLDEDSYRISTELQDHPNINVAEWWKNL